MSTAPAPAADYPADALALAVSACVANSRWLDRFDTDVSVHWSNHPSSLGVPGFLMATVEPHRRYGSVLAGSPAIEPQVVP